MRALKVFSTNARKSTGQLKSRVSAPEISRHFFGDTCPSSDGLDQLGNLPKLRRWVFLIILVQLKQDWQVVLVQLVSNGLGGAVRQQLAQVF